MNHQPLVEAPLAVQIHLAMVVPALLIGTWLIIFSTKGARAHRALGAIHLVLMTATAATTVFVRKIAPGRLRWIPLFVPLALYGVIGALWHVRRGNIRGHRNAMIGLYIGIIGAGAATFISGRLLKRVFLG
jgi:uncharacterized membrane protein